MRAQCRVALWSACWLIKSNHDIVWIDMFFFVTNVCDLFLVYQIWSTSGKLVQIEIICHFFKLCCFLCQNLVCAGSSQVVWRASWQLCLMPPPATPSQFNQEYWFKLSLQKKETNCPRSPWRCCCFSSESFPLSSNLMWQMWEKQLEGHLKLCVMLAAGAAVKRVLILTFFVEQPILLLLLPSCHEIPTLPERPKPPNCHFTQFSEDTLMGPKPPDCYFAQFSEDNIRVPTPFDCLAGFLEGPKHQICAATFHTIIREQSCRVKTYLVL